MGKPLPHHPTFWNDLMGQARASGLTLAEMGVLFSLMWAQSQSVQGSLPANLDDIRRIVGNDATKEQIKTVVNQFFPLTAEGRRANEQHAQAWATALTNYEAKVRRGRIAAEKRWSEDGSGNGSANGSRTSLVTRAPTPTRARTRPTNQNSTTGIPRERRTAAPLIARCQK
jgi:hypothetical protein